VVELSSTTSTRLPTNSCTCAGSWASISFPGWKWAMKWNSLPMPVHSLARSGHHNVDQPQRNRQAQSGSAEFRVVVLSA